MPVRGRKVLAELDRASAVGAVYARHRAEEAVRLSVRGRSGRDRGMAGIVATGGEAVSVYAPGFVSVVELPKG